MESSYPTSTKQLVDISILSVIEHCNTSHYASIIRRSVRVLTSNRFASKHHRNSKGNRENEGEDDADIHHLPGHLGREDAKVDETKAKLGEGYTKEVAQLVKVYQL